MNYLYDKIISSSSWSFQNKNNIYNFIIAIMNMSGDTEKKIIIEELKINCGINFFNLFRDYTIRKLGIKHNLIIFLE